MQLYQQHSLFPRKYAIKIHRTNFGKLYFQENELFTPFLNEWPMFDVTATLHHDSIEKSKNKWKLHYNIKFCTMEFKVILNEINLMNCSKTVNAIGEQVIHLSKSTQTKYYKINGKYTLSTDFPFIIIISNFIYFLFK